MRVRRTGQGAKHLSRAFATPLCAVQSWQSLIFHSIRRPRRPAGLEVVAKGETLITFTLRTVVPEGLVGNPVSFLCNNYDTGFPTKPSGTTDLRLTVLLPPAFCDDL